MTAAGSPGEEVLDSAEDTGRDVSPRSRRLAGALVLVAVLVVGLFAFRALQPEPVADQSEPSATSTTSRADPSLVDDSARRLYGDSGIGGAQNFSTAINAATTVVRVLCRTDIPSWAATLVTSSDSYDQATFLMSPANRTYGTFVVQVELTWSVDHYLYAVVAGHIEQCV
ncbi:MAG: hypothetical protein H0T54_03380 [Geodermatophilaceae bacterium]|nr:hypothetical protein [Geodermatophilaceae bacterium]